MDYNKIIRDKLLNKEVKLQLMDDKKLQMLDETAKYLSEWYEEETLKTVKIHAAKLREMTEDRARTLKSRIKDLKNNTKEIVNNHLNKEELWWHTKENKYGHYSFDNRILPEIITPIQIAMGELGLILKDYELDRSPENKSSRWGKDTYDNYMYMIFLNQPEGLCKLSRDYINLIMECKKIDEEITKAEDELKKQNIEEWWASL